MWLVGVLGTQMMTQHHPCNVVQFSSPHSSVSSSTFLFVFSFYFQHSQSMTVRKGYIGHRHVFCHSAVIFFCFSIRDMPCSHRDPKHCCLSIIKQKRNNQKKKKGICWRVIPGEPHPVLLDSDCWASSPFLRNNSGILRSQRVGQGGARCWLHYSVRTKNIYVC